MKLEIYQVDSFTNEAFTGNPAGVCITEHPLDESLMFSIAAEIAVSETAFLSLNDFNLRWFTPEVEVNLCGHGTLAMAHILKQKGLVAIGEGIVFETLSGPLEVTVGEHDIDMLFPTAELEFDTLVNTVLLELLGLKLSDVVSYVQFGPKYLIEIRNEEILRSLSPNFDGLNELEGRGVVVTAKSDFSHVDFVSRHFAPWVGINEDPVTGSAHCALAVYWAEKLNKVALKGFQASKRGGFVGVELMPNKKVKLTGSAITVIEGIIHV